MKIKYFKSRADADRLLQIAFYRHFNVLTYRPFHLKNRADSGVRVELCEGNSSAIRDEWIRF